MPKSVILSIQHGDILEANADLLALKHCQWFHGLDRYVKNRLVEAGIPSMSIKPAIGKHSVVETRGAINQPKVLFVGLPPLEKFSFSTAHSFGELVIGAITASAPETRHVAMTIHGEGIGLHPIDCFRSQCEGLLDAARKGTVSPYLKKISIYNRNKENVRLMRNSFETGAPILGVKPTVEAPGVYRIMLPDKAFAKLEVSSEAIESNSQQRSGEERPHVFVAMPFDRRMDDVYFFGIESPVKAAGLECERTDRSAFTEAIVERIKNKISDSKVVIGEMTGANPNVYLEIGYAWGKNRHTLLACKSGGELHRSAKHHHCIMYESIGDLKRYLEKELKRISMQQERSALEPIGKVEANQIYVSAPGDKDMDDTFEFGIKNPVQELGLMCKRVNKGAVAADWNESSRKSIEGAGLVIAALTGGDPNVYLDVGYAWAKGKPTILVAKNGENLAYDVSGYRCLLYHSIMELKKMVTTEVKALKPQMTG